jgi:hypothetical protein
MRARPIAFRLALAATLMCPAPMAAQAGAGDPNSVVYMLYRNYRPGSAGMATPGFGTFLTPEARTQLNRARAADELEADPFCDCQDWETIEVQAVLLTFDTADTATAAASIADTVDGRKPRSIVFRLRRTSVGWRVHDVGPEGGWSLRAVFEPKPKG